MTASVIAQLIINSPYEEPQRHWRYDREKSDFLARLVTGEMLILETKGQDTEQDQVKRRYLAEWVEAVNIHGGFGRWRWAVARQPGDIRDILAAMMPVATGGQQRVEAATLEQKTDSPI